MCLSKEQRCSALERISWGALILQPARNPLHECTYLQVGSLSPPLLPAAQHPAPLILTKPILHTQTSLSRADLYPCGFEPFPNRAGVAEQVRCTLTRRLCKWAEREPRHGQPGHSLAGRTLPSD